MTFLALLPFVALVLTEAFSQWRADCTYRSDYAVLMAKLYTVRRVPSANSSWGDFNRYRRAMWGLELLADAQVPT